MINIDVFSYNLSHVLFFLCFFPVFKCVQRSGFSVSFSALHALKMIPDMPTGLEILVGSLLGNGSYTH